MQDHITCRIEVLSLDVLQSYLRYQADEVFPSLKDEEKLLTFVSKLHNYAEFCVCRYKGQLVGMIAFYANGRGADFGYIPHVYVSPGYRGKGICSRMLDVVVCRMKEQGFHEVRLQVEKKNIRAQHSYQRKGFEIMPSPDLNICSYYMRKTI